MTKPLSLLYSGAISLGTLSADVGDFGGVIELGGGVLDHNATQFYGGNIGLSYESTLGRHYLMLGGGFALNEEFRASPLGRSNQVSEDVSFISAGYRHGFTISDKFEPFIELGYGEASTSLGGVFDGFGNPIQAERESNFFYGKVGLSYRLYENLHLVGSVTFLHFNDESPFGEFTSDPIGNPTFQSSDVNFLTQIGLSFRF